VEKNIRASNINCGYVFFKGYGRLSIFNTKKLMKNIVEEKPTDELHGRSLYNTQFVSDEDIKDKNVLDIGCGFGWFELNARKRGVKKIIGIELEEKDLETAKKFISSEKIDFKKGSAIELPFPNNSFDTIVSWEVIEHIPKNTEEKMFQEASRVLRNGGSFYLSTPYDSFFAKIFDPAWWLIGHRHYSKKKLTTAGEDNGFKIEKIIIKGGWWEILGINNLYIAKWIFRRRPFFENFINKKQNEEYGSENNGLTNAFVKYKK